MEFSNNHADPRSERLYSALDLQNVYFRFAIHLTYKQGFANELREVIPYIGGCMKESREVIV